MDTSIINRRSDKVKIPKSLLVHIVSLLEDLEIEDYDPDTVQLYGYVIYSLKRKKAGFEKDNLCCYSGYNCMHCDDELPF